MEGENGIAGGMLQRSLSPEMLRLELPANAQQQEAHQLFAPMPQPRAYAAYSCGASGGRGKQQQTQSSEEEIGFGGENASARVSQSQTNSPWQRMKWTDGMVRLLVWVVHSVGDDGSGGGGDGPEQQQKGRKGQVAVSSSSSAAAAAAAAGLQQKKGKWKSVSRAMMEKGFYVSPQQCEDKFNDLNKRYKRVNEILGKGTACQVVENPTLLDSMDHLSYKAKEEARKLLSSKHLFFREMCAYHNSPPNGGGSGCGGSGATAADLPDHSSSVSHSIKGRKGGSGGGLGTVEEEIRRGHSHEVDNDGKEEEDDDDGDYIDEDDSDDEDHDGEEEEDDKGMIPEAGGSGAKRKAAITSPVMSSPLSLSLSSPSGSTSAPMQQLRNEMMGLQGEEQQRQWLRMRAAELEEQRLVYQQRGLQIERQRFKWLRFSSNKEREMERNRLQNQRLRIENERMLLLLQQKELRLLEAGTISGSNISHQSRVDPSQHNRR
ncbi:hypothetical protein HPP92_009549 [Vanilla planifolia]|uniref:Myb/SANT-like DNA-binding domain-containing protein n=1 Tax=Vanilla planifolia TaxID=51239 RepID=A0A835REH1_VANPL|nr:hypothetical protein HPP92_009764 [Vanilla planifolia]KAG0487454.1 hypothetical protein HPP92_009549 [Vanilla planifolia]